MRVLFDGWSLAHAPIGPSALHLLSILPRLENEIAPLLALPEPAPDWLGDYSVHVKPIPDTPLGRLRWEQSHLPALARKLGADLLHLTSPTPPALSSTTTLFSPTGFGALPPSWSGIEQPVGETRGVLNRLRLSLGQGGLMRTKTIIWPSDLPKPGPPGRYEILPPILPPIFPAGARNLSGDHPGLPARSANLEQLPGEFILYHGPGAARHLDLLIQAWSWAAGAIGEYYPLLLIGLSASQQHTVSGLAGSLGLGGSLRFVQDVTPGMLSQIYQRCRAVFHPAPASLWCGPVRMALAAGKPLVGIEDSMSGAIAGPAAYLVGEKDARALGAALVTVVVEEELASSLSAAARKRVQEWDSAGFSKQLHAVYLDAASQR